MNGSKEPWARYHAVPARRCALPARKFARKADAVRFARVCVGRSGVAYAVWRQEAGEGFRLVRLIKPSRPSEREKRE
jgi:hypothetical protein